MTQRLNNIFTALSLAILAITANGCSGADAPDNFEPSITMSEATDITRTGAVISAHIERHGDGKLSYVTIYHGVSGKDDWTASSCDPDAETVTVRLEGLTPGVSYTCFAETGTSTASIRSNTISFTTIPNNKPSLDPLTILSAGPVGIIVGINITDDGGEPLIEAGCEVTDASGGSVVKLTLPTNELTVGNHRITVSGLSGSSQYTLTPFAANTAGTTYGIPVDYRTSASVMLEEAGQLAALFAGCDPSAIPDPLTVAGMMNGDDFRFLRVLLGAPATDGSTINATIGSVDLTDVTICEGGNTYNGERFTVADRLTTDIFADCTRLRHILLPSSAVALERDAFARCTTLETLLIPADIAQLLPSSDCTALESIEVSPANENYSSIDGVLFSHDCTDILWFPVGKTGTYTLPSTITSIGEEAFAGTSITGLEIPSSVTSISRGAFARSALIEISLPDNITNISTGMFQNCTGLQTVHLGNGTELIGDYVFDGTSLTDLYVAATYPPVVSTNSFVNKSESITTNCTLHVPAGSKAIYRNHQRWGKFAKIAEF